MPTVDHWRVERMCSNCPFMPAGKGKQLWDGLADGRREEILGVLESDGFFLCHKTTENTGDGTELVCAGSIDWQKERGYSSIWARICQALEAPVA